MTVMKLQCKKKKFITVFYYEFRSFCVQLLAFFDLSTMNICICRFTVFILFPRILLTSDGNKDISSDDAVGSISKYLKIATGVHVQWQLRDINILENVGYVINSRMFHWIKSHKLWLKYVHLHDSVKPY